MSPIPPDQPNGAAITCRDAREIARVHYGLGVTARRLTGERDENFHLDAGQAGQFTLKIADPAEDPACVDLTNAALRHIAASDASFPCPRIHADLHGRASTQIVDAAQRPRIVRMLSWLPGQPLLTSTRSTAQRVACGQLAARLGQVLCGFTHPAARRPLLWDIENVAALGPMLDEIPGFTATRFVIDVIAQFGAAARPAFARLRRQVVHNDMNVRNLLVDPQDHARIVGLIDFGDMLETARVADVATVASAQITEPGTVQRDIVETVDAYRAIAPLDDDELSVLNWYIAARLVMGMVIPAWHHVRHPDSAHFTPKTEAELARRMDVIHRVLALRLD